MGTHGTLAIRKKELVTDEVFVFHATHSGYEVAEFMQRNPKVDSIDSLVLDAFRFCSNFDKNQYSDRSSVNIYVEDFREDFDYSDIAEYSVYYDGQSWHHNLESD